MSVCLFVFLFACLSTQIYIAQVNTIHTRFSEDHVSLYVGDARGRVFCWTPNDSMGKQADHWVLDSGTKV